MIINYWIIWGKFESRISQGGGGYFPPPHFAPVIRCFRSFEEIFDPGCIGYGIIWDYFSIIVDFWVILGLNTTFFTYFN